MQALIIDDEFRSRITQVREFASRPENLYKPGPEAVCPGDNPNYVVESGNVRIVFSLTWMFLGEWGTYRHISISVNNQKSVPHPVVVKEVLDLFGFIGGWDLCDYCNVENNIFIGLQDIRVTKEEAVA